MKKGKKSSQPSGYGDIDLEDFDMPRYLEAMEPIGHEEPVKPNKQLTHYIEDVWVPQPELIEKSLAQLEKQDKEYRQRLVQDSDNEKVKASQLILQRSIYKDLLDIGIKLHQLPNFTNILEFKKYIRGVAKGLLALQNKMSCVDHAKLANIEETSGKVWDWMAGLAREWTSRVDLRIGADIIEQVLRESEKKHDFDIQVHLMRELKTENTVIAHSTTKKVKHKFSKHRKLKFDIHEKLQNFMTPQHAHWESKHENLIKSLFGKRTESLEKVYLDIPLV